MASFSLGHSKQLWSVIALVGIVFIGALRILYSRSLWPADLSPTAILPADEAVTTISFSPDNQTMAVAGTTTISLWNVTTWHRLRTLTLPHPYTVMIAFSADGTLLAVSGRSAYENTIWVWKVADGSLISTAVGLTSGIYSLAFNPDSQYLALGTHASDVLMWSLRERRVMTIFSADTASVLDPIESVAFSSNGQFVAAGGGGRTLRVWRVRDKALLRSISSVGVSWYSAVSADGQRAVTWYETGTDIDVWDLQRAHSFVHIPGEGGNIFCAALSPNGALAAVGSGDRNSDEVGRATHDYRIHIWRISDGKPFVTLTGHTGNVTSIAFSPDGHVLATGSADKTVRIWQITNGE